jgi:hypothetical protein|tara:strand:+ start:1321 stop:1596 length:276 start_codon:yes stop_codon:yes gene_type:complete
MANRYRKAAKAAMEKEKGGLSEARERMEKKGTVGEFTAKAKRAGYTKEDGAGDAQAYASHVLSNKDKFDEETIKQAQFAKNMGDLAKKKDE